MEQERQASEASIEGRPPMKNEAFVVLTHRSNPADQLITIASLERKGETPATETMVVIPAFDCASCGNLVNHILVCQHSSCGYFNKRTQVKERIGQWLSLLRLPASRNVTADGIAQECSCTPSLSSSLLELPLPS
jgi:hypothetical protein